MPVSIVPGVKLNGADLADGWTDNMVELRIEREYQTPGRCTMRFSDPGYNLAQSGTAAPAARVEVSSPSSSSTKLFTGEVVAIAVEQRPSEQPEFVVTALDKSHRLGRKAQAKAYENGSYDSIVSQLLGDAGVPGDVSSTSGTYVWTLQADSGLGMLTEIARRVGYDWWVDEGGTLHFAKPPASAPAGATSGSGVTDTTEGLTLALGKNLWSFSARASSQAPTGVAVVGWDRAQKQEFTGMSTATVPRPTSAIAGNVSTSAFGSVTVTTPHGAPIDGDEATLIGTGIANDWAARSVRAEGLGRGNSAITLGAFVSVVDAGPLSGSYQVTRLDHTFRQRLGWTTRFWSGDRRPTTLVDSLAGNGSGSGALRSNFRTTGLVVGVVTNNKEQQSPALPGMVRVQYPLAGSTSDVISAWARVAAAGAGNNRGSVWVPEVGDEVLIGFEFDDPRHPVVLGGLYGGQNASPTATVDSNVETRSFTSRLGHVMSMLDGSDPGQQAIELVLAGTNTKLHLGKDGVTIVAGDNQQSGLSISTNAPTTPSITFDSQGNITIKGNTIKLQAQQKVAISGQAGVNVDSNAQLQLTGMTASLKANSVLQVQASGPTTIKGEPVQIN